LRGRRGARKNAKVTKNVWNESAPMPNIVKVPAEMWIKTARKALIAEGLGGVKVDRLAKMLGVSRGGFYHNFKSHDELMDRLLEDWATSNEFVPMQTSYDSPAEAFAAFEEMIDRMILEKDFSSAFEMAVREWGRIDAKVKRIVDRVDNERIERLTALFSALGCDEAEAPIRARILYYHQIGFYALGHQKHQSKADRLRTAPIYLSILCGPHYHDAEKLSAKANSA